MNINWNDPKIQAIAKNYSIRCNIPLERAIKIIENGAKHYQAKPVFNWIN